MSAAVLAPATSPAVPVPVAAVPATAAPAAGAPLSAQPAGPFQPTSLYVGDLHPNASEHDLYQFFSQIGGVASVRVCRDAVTRRSLCYAYVNFHAYDDAERAVLILNGQPVHGKPVRIMWSQRDPSGRRAGVGNLFVKNLVPGTDNKRLLDAFSPYGNILSCKVLTDETGQCKGYGYVHMESQESAENAVRSPPIVDGVQLSVAHFVKRQDRSRNVLFTNLYVKNVPKAWDDARLQQEFAKFGEITSAVVVRVRAEDVAQAQAAAAAGSAQPVPELGASRGFGFVNFKDADAASAAAAACNGMKPDETQEHALYVGQAQKKADRVRELRTRMERIRMDAAMRYQGRNLYVKGLEADVTEDELRTLFAQFGTVTSVRIMRDQATNVSKGFGFVCLATPEEANKAVAAAEALNVRGKTMYVAFHQRKEQRMQFLNNVRMTRMMQSSAAYAPLYMFGRGPQYPGAQFMMPMMGNPAARGPRPMGMQRPYPMPQYLMMGGAQGQPQQQQLAAMQAMQPQMAAAAAAAMRRPQQGMPPQMGMPPMMMMQQGMPQMVPQPQMAQQQPRARARAVGPRGPMGQPQMGRGKGSFAYTAQARNQPQEESAVLPEAPVAQPAPTAPQQMPVLTPQMLAEADPRAQKNMIGERLYPQIMPLAGQMAAKITGMLLEMDNVELLHLLESPMDLASKVQEAKSVLEKHQAATRQA